MEERKVWYCKWSDRKNKVFYVNIDTKEASWIKPEGFKETEDELKRISDWTSTPKKTPTNGTKVTDPENGAAAAEQHKRKPGTPESEPHKKVKRTTIDRSKSPSTESCERKAEPATEQNSYPKEVRTPEKSNPERSGATDTNTPTKDFGCTPPNEPEKKRKRRRVNKSPASVQQKDINAVIMKEEPDKPEAEDFLEVYSEKRKMPYYCNLKTGASQWKRPPCLQAADTQKAIERLKLKGISKVCVSNGATATPSKTTEENIPERIKEDDKISNSNLKVKTVNVISNSNLNVETDVISNSNLNVEADVMPKSNLNVDAPVFKMNISSLNVNAQPFVPRSVSPETPLSDSSTPFSQREITTTDTCDTPLSRKGIKNGTRTRKVMLKRRDLSEPTKQPRSSASDRRSAKDRLSERVVKDRVGSERDGATPRSVHQRLGIRHPDCTTERVLYSDVSSNVRVEERHLVRLSYLPPHPDTEILRYQEVANLRHTFASLCRDKLDLEEPTEALNRWLLEQQLSRKEIIDPLLCYSDTKSVSMYREIMQDVPVKLKLGRNTRTCTSSLEKFSMKMITLAHNHLTSEKDKEGVQQKCKDILIENKEYSDTRALMDELRSSCQEYTDKYYKPIVENICSEMSTKSRESAIKIQEYAEKEGLHQITALSPPPLSSTKLVGCRPAQPLISTVPFRGDITATITGSGRDKQCKIKYEDTTMSLNYPHYRKLDRLHSDSASDEESDKTVLHVRIWCLMKRYKMLRSSMTGGKLQSENFGLHAALPRKAFELLNRRFGVTFECFASPFNCYFSQYCSAFPDIDCYFGSRGSFFEFRPKSGSFQANPPFSEEVMLGMANHMIQLLEDTTEPLMFVIFVPDWRDPITPAIPRLTDTIYCTHKILLESGTHQYITGNQHVQGASHYDAVHGTMVFVLQNDAACDSWPLRRNNMLQLRDAMSYNREWY